MVRGKGYHASIPLLLAFTFIICFLALCGDLFESFLKRKAHVKDSGHILPGHGGFLDRFDGIMFAALFFFIFKNQLVYMLGI
jgi:phosphatidate cytidylyltransferase